MQSLKDVMLEARRRTAEGDTADSVIDWIGGELPGVRVNRIALRAQAAPPRRNKVIKIGAASAAVAFVEAQPPEAPATPPEAPATHISLHIFSTRAQSLQYECNGIVVEVGSWRIVANPPSALNKVAPFREVDAHMSVYDVYPVDDGTILTLYHPQAGGDWALASHNGYDVSRYRWIGALTYAEIVFDLFMRLYPEFVAATGPSLANGALAFRSLSTARSYTFGFRHHNHHPLTVDPERIWQIQCSDTTQLDPVVAADALPGIPQQQAWADAPGGLRALIASTADSLANAVARVAAGSGAALNYGYILRSRDSARTGALSNVLISSLLLTTVRRNVYDQRVRPTAATSAPRHPLLGDERLEFGAMRAFLAAGNMRSDFIALYPSWAPRFQVFDQFTKRVIAAIVHSLRQHSQGSASAEPVMGEPMGEVVRALIKFIRKHEPTLTAFQANAAAIIRDYVINPEYALMFIRALAPAS